MIDGSNAAAGVRLQAGVSRVMKELEKFSRVMKELEKFRIFHHATGVSLALFMVKRQVKPGV